MTGWNRFLGFLEWSDADAGVLAALDWAALAGPYTDAFYARIRAVPELDRLVREHSSYERLAAALQEYVRRLADPPVGEAYLERMRAVARVHGRVGLSPDWYLGAYRLLWEYALQAAWGRREAGLPAALAKRLTADLVLTISAYQELMEERNRELETARSLLSGAEQQLTAEAAELAAAATQARAAGGRMAQLLAAVAEEGRTVREQAQGAVTQADAGSRAMTVLGGQVAETRKTLEEVAAAEAAAALEAVRAALDQAVAAFTAVAGRLEESGRSIHELDAATGRLESQAGRVAALAHQLTAPAGAGKEAMP
ncbi:MAG: protoglobin domain-containing protein [Firmicutes bacterium]|nr:protoglobin domain-containing protein [Bacillota bacterium]